MIEREIARAHQPHRDAQQAGLVAAQVPVRLGLQPGAVDQALHSLHRADIADDMAFGHPAEGDRVLPDAPEVEVPAAEIGQPRLHEQPWRVFDILVQDRQESDAVVA
jgi:hypothetical protein